MPCAASGPSRDRSLSPSSSRSRSTLKPHLCITILLAVGRNFHVNAGTFLSYFRYFSPLIVSFYIARVRRLYLLKQKVGGNAFHPVILTPFDGSMKLVTTVTR